MRSVLAYTSARIVIFIATFGVLYLLGAKSWLGLLLAVAISGVISYVLLARRRDEMSAAVVAGARNTRHRFEAARTKEDFEASPAAENTAPAEDAKNTPAAREGAPE